MTGTDAALLSPGKVLGLKLHCSGVGPPPPCHSLSSDESPDLRLPFPPGSPAAPTLLAKGDTTAPTATLGPWAPAEETARGSRRLSCSGQTHGECTQLPFAHTRKPPGRPHTLPLLALLSFLSKMQHRLQGCQAPPAPLLLSPLSVSILPAFPQSKD